MMPSDDENLADLLVSKGLLSSDERAEAERTGRPLAEALVELGLLTREQLEDARAALQNRVRFCGRCNSGVPVPRMTREGERCPHCLGPLAWKEAAPAADPEEIDLVQLASDELPPDVLVTRTRTDRRFGKYILLGEIGQGGEGVVQKAWDTMMAEYVALKFIREPHSVPNSLEEARQRRHAQILGLIQEARSALRLRHDHIVGLRDVGSVGRQVFISMDYIEGETLADRISASHARGRLSPLYEDPAHYLGMLRDIADAMHYAHTLNPPVVHCDLKPANILIDASGVGYVMDFGLARVLLAGREDELVVRGTPAYMAPEQLTGHSIDIGPWTDVYGLGAVLYELLTGRPAYTGDTPDIMVRMMREAPARPSDVVRSTKEGSRRDSTRLLARASRLEAICMRCLAKDPRQRFRATQDVAQELEKVLASLQETDALPPKVRQAQERAEFRRIEEQLTVLRIEEAQAEIARLDGQAHETRVRAWLTQRRCETETLQRFRDRLVRRLNERRPGLEKLRLVGSELGAVEVIKSTPRKLFLFHVDRVLELEWASLPPTELARLAEAAGLDAPEDRLALGITLHHARLSGPAETCLSSLLGTPLEAEARAVMDSEPA